MHARLALLAFLLVACKDGTPVDDSPRDSRPPEEDRDGDDDGYEADLDCDDTDPAVNPGVPETPYNGVDDDCDPTSPDDDLDGDGYLGADDCADDDETRHPDAIEACDGIDQDCDGEVDESAGDLWYADLDEDGYGDPSTARQGCEPGDGYVADATDCNDRIATVYPGAPEVCDELDNNCDGVTDEGVTTTWYQDLDGDGYGDAAFTAESCDPPTGYAAASTDCDDGDDAVNPDAGELCNGTDDDCDGQTDEPDAVDAPTWYADADRDGYGDPASSSRACTAPGGAVSNADDCDDTDAAIQPNTVWYLDYDGDGYGDPGLSQTQCAQPSRFLLDSSDCDDRDANQNPAAAELCNGEDDDCDGLVDTDDPDGPAATTWFQDADGDGYGDPNTASSACAQPTGAVADGSDCDDGAADAHPGALELRDGLDNDCDGEGYDGPYAPTSSATLATGTWEFTSFDVPAGVTITVSGAGALELLVVGDAAIDGTLDLAGADGQGHGAFGSAARVGGAGGGGGGGDGGDGACYNRSTGAQAGGGASGGGAATSGSAGAGGGGGGAVLAGTDGGAGVCTQARCGNTNTWAGGAGGPALGGVGPQLLAGSGGGGGGWGTADNGDGGGGGGGGGALYLLASRLDIGGMVDCSGGEGGGDPNGYDGGSGGGGSGGTLWLVADTLTVTGTLACWGGAGGSTVVGGTTARGGGGGAGADGAIWVDAASATLSGTIDPAVQAVP